MTTDTDTAADPREFYTLAEIAEKLPFTEKTVRQMLADGELCAFIKVRRTILIPRSAWEAWVRKASGLEEDEDAPIMHKVRRRL